MTSDNEEQWLQAGTAIFGSPPNLRPLVRLLRGKTAIPEGVRDTLAGLLDPEGPGYLYFRLELKNLDSKRHSHHKDITEIMRVAVRYKKLVAKGFRAERVAEKLGEIFSISDRTVFTYVSTWNDIEKWLRGK